MKDDIKRAYSKVGMSEADKLVVLNNIKTRTKRKNTRYMAWTAAVVIATAAIVVAFALGGALPNKSNTIEIAEERQEQTVSQTPKSTTEVSPVVAVITLSMNPSVEFRLDEEGLVIEVVGTNEDGIALVEGIEFEGMTLENATIVVVNQLILQEYITAVEIVKEINLSFSDGITSDTLSVMTEIIETAAAEHNIAVDVIEDEETNALQIVMEGQGAPSILPDPDEPNEGPNELNEDPDEPSENPDIPLEDRPVGLEVEFVMTHGTYSAYVDNVLIHTKDGETIDCLLDFVDSTLGKAALRGIVELLEKGYINSEDDGSVTKFSFIGSCKEADILSVAQLTELLIAEYDLKIAVHANTKDEAILLVHDVKITHQAQVSKFAITDVLNRMVNKDEKDLSPRQIEILKSVFTYREYYRLLEKRYFIVIPDLVGMNEEQAIELLQQVGLVPSVVREKVSGYDPSQENGGLAHTDPSLSPEEQGQIEGPIWDSPVVDFGCVFYQDGMAGQMSQSGMHLQINVVVPEDDEREEVLDFRPDSGIVLRDMDVPFEISAYPDTFLLSDASGFDVMIKDMNACYLIEDKSDYTVVINRDTGWQDTAIITITHKDGFPQSKYFLQDEIIVEVEFLWRRGVPTAEDE